MRVANARGERESQRGALHNSYAPRYTFSESVTGVSYTFSHIRAEPCQKGTVCLRWAAWLGCALQCASQPQSSTRLDVRLRL
eukprot:5776151-Prymnesium_polylepis.1